MSDHERLRNQLIRLAGMWRTAERYQNGPDGTKRVSVGDKSNAEALALENEIVADMGALEARLAEVESYGQWSRQWVGHLEVALTHASTPETHHPPDCYYCRKAWAELRAIHNKAQPDNSGVPQS